VKDSWERSLFYASPHHGERGLEEIVSSVADLKKNLGRYYRHSFLPTFKRQSLSVNIDLRHAVSHSDTWRLEGGRTGILLRPFYISSFKLASKQYSEEEKNLIVEGFRATDDPYELIIFFSLALDYLRKGWLPLPFTMEIREEILKRLKKTDDLSFKEIFSQFMRVLIHYQRLHFLPEIEKRLEIFEKQSENKKAFLNVISKLETQYIEKGDRSVEEIRQIVCRELKQYLDQTSLYQKRIVNLVDALSIFLEQKNAVSLQELEKEIKILKGKYPIPEEIEKAIEESDTTLLREKLGLIRDTLSAQLKESKQDLERIRRLNEDLERHQQKVSSTDIQKRFELLRTQTVSEIEKNFKQQEALNVNLDLIRTDEKIFDSEEPWEKLD